MQFLTRSSGILKHRQYFKKL